MQYIEILNNSEVMLKFIYQKQHGFSNLNVNIIGMPLLKKYISVFNKTNQTY